MPILGRISISRRCFPEGGAADPQLLAQLRLVEFFSGFQTDVDDVIDQHPQDKIFSRFLLSAF